MLTPVIMTCQQANEISIVEFLKNYNFHPAYIRGYDFWYFSPLRDEKTPSFKVNDALNVFYDHGEGKGGNLIDLGCLLLKCNVKELLSILDENSFFFHQQVFLKGPARIPDTVNQIREDPKIVINHVKPLGNNPAISDYLNSRGISVAIAKPYCREIYYQLGDKNYFAVGFENRSGGYELRNAFFKGSSSPKDISHIENSNRSVCVLEGFMDFLSLLTLRKESPVRSDFLILNSVSFVDRSMEILKNYRNIFLYLDHDHAGRKALDKCEAAGLNTIDSSITYQKFKDLNEYLLDQHSRQQEQNQRRDLKKSRGLGL